MSLLRILDPGPSDPGVVGQEMLAVRGGRIAEGVNLAAALEDRGSAHA